MDMTIHFPGNSRVDASFGEFVVKTDQPQRAGGEGQYPAPFDYFLASLGSCAGVYVLNFLRQRNLPTDKARLTLHTVRGSEPGLLSEIHIRVSLPEAVPRKYHRAIQNAVNLCAVKRHLASPPRIETVVEIDECISA